MSATIIQPATPRRQRSQLAVPASNPRFIEKAAQSTADVIFLDLEDAVAPAEKSLRARMRLLRSMILTGVIRPYRYVLMVWTPNICIAM